MESGTQGEPRKRALTRGHPRLGSGRRGRAGPQHVRQDDRNQEGGKDPARDADRAMISVKTRGHVPSAARRWAPVGVAAAGERL